MSTKKVGIFSEYDHVIPLGEACFVATFLKDLGVRAFSGPFDWLMGADLESRLELVLNEFKDFFNIEDFQCITKEIEDGLIAEGLTDFPTKHEIYVNTRTKIHHNHDFLRDMPLEKSYPEAKEKFDRRIERFLDLLRSDVKILFFYVDMPKDDVQRADQDKLTELLVRLNIHFRAADIHLMYFHHVEDPAPNIRILNKYIELGEYYKGEDSTALQPDLRDSICTDAAKVITQAPTL